MGNARVTGAGPAHGASRTWRVQEARHIAPSRARCSTRSVDDTGNAASPLAPE